MTRLHQLVAVKKKVKVQNVTLQSGPCLLEKRNANERVFLTKNQQSLCSGEAAQEVVSRVSDTRSDGCNFRTRTAVSVLWVEREELLMIKEKQHETNKN